tara:strand:+ start:3008 stop:3250 length:243 start_codon:yes stop_codon:yes gene_type:complete
MENISSSTDNDNYSPEGIALILAGVAAAIGSVVYSFKSVVHSDCGWFSCDQFVKDEELHIDDILKLESTIKNNILQSTDL